MQVKKFHIQLLERELKYPQSYYNHPKTIFFTVLNGSQILNALNEVSRRYLRFKLLNKNRNLAFMNNEENGKYKYKARGSEAILIA